MALLPSSVKELAELGADIEITEAGGYLPSSVIEVIKIAAAKGGHITVHAGRYLPSSLKEMVTSGNGNVTIVV